MARTTDLTSERLYYRLSLRYGLSDEAAVGLMREARLHGKSTAEGLTVTHDPDSDSYELDEPAPK